MRVSLCLPYPQLAGDTGNRVQAGPTQSLYPLRGPVLTVKGTGFQGQLVGCGAEEGQPQGTLFPENRGLALTPSHS